MDYSSDMDYSSLICTEDDVITPFPGNPAANLNRDERRTLRYGLQPGCTSLVEELAATVHATLEHCQPHALSAAAKACLRGYLCEPDLLTPDQKQGSSDNYTRRLLYASPDRDFSILALIWLPGQVTPIHGHTAWGAAGVFEGHPFAETFTPCEIAPKVMGLRAHLKARLKPGDIATVEPGIDDAHRIGNDSRERAVTIHIYGRDLLANPGSINIVFNS